MNVEQFKFLKFYLSCRFKVEIKVISEDSSGSMVKGKHITVFVNVRKEESKPHLSPLYDK